MKILIIGESSKHLEAVIDLGNRYSKTLGFFPKGAYVEKAKQDRIIVAVNDMHEVLGYLLYEVNRRDQLAYIVHLCVDEKHRNSNIAKKLFSKLKEVTRELRGIRVRCRRDYDANSFWPKLHFNAVNDMPGRSEAGSTLTIWWYDHGVPDLFSNSKSYVDEAKTSVVLDANIFFDLIGEETAEGIESKALQADWLLENTNLCLTPEIYNEIDRNPDRKERRDRRKQINQFEVLKSKNKQIDPIVSELSKLYNGNISKSDESDIRQLSHTIACSVKIFITRDESLLLKKTEIAKNFDIILTKPAEFIISRDELIRKSEYSPMRLSGSSITMKRIAKGDINVLISTFSDGSNETKGQFKRKALPYFSDPHRYDSEVILDNGNPIALIVSETFEDRINLPIFRILKGKLSSTLTRHLLHNSVEKSIRNKISVTSISETNLTEDTINALSEVGFIPLGSRWAKVNILGVLPRKSVAEKLSLILQNFPELSQHFNLVVSFLIQDTCDNTQLIMIEKMLWPLKFEDMVIQNFIVPIQPYWAMHLFDRQYSEEDLFGGKPHLLFNIENVYYRNSSKLVSSPARILWYVSESNWYPSSKSVRACSYINEIQIGSPSSLYRKYKNLGIYEKKDVKSVANSSSSNSVMAFTFNRTEILTHPVSYDTLKEIYEEETNKHLVIQSPISIKNDAFIRIYNKGILKSKNI